MPRSMTTLLIDIYHTLRGDVWLKYTPKPVQSWANEIRLRQLYDNRTRLVIDTELANKYKDALLYLSNKYGKDSIGDYFEFGVFNGTSIITMYRVLDELGYKQTRIFGFDSFEGLPSSATTDDNGHWKPGWFKSELELTMYVLQRENVNLSRVVLTKGFFEHTLTEDLRKRHNHSKASIIMVDCDMYLSAKEALEYCVPMILDEAVILFDDWFPLADRNLGEKKAFDEFLQKYPHFDFKEFGTYPPHAKIFTVSREPEKLQECAASGL